MLILALEGKFDEENSCYDGSRGLSKIASLQICYS